MARYLIATAPATLTISLHTFTNSIESIVLALALLAWNRPTARARILLGALLSFGFFLRVSFVFFALPLGLHALIYDTRHIHLTALAFVVMSTLFLGVDRLFYGRWVMTPLNLLRYNLQPENLALHGIHPRWLHLVNINLVVGTPIVLTFLLTVYQRGSNALKDINFWIIMSSLSLFSSQTHQEPRFLLPLVVQFVMICTARKTSTRLTRLFWVGPPGRMRGFADL